MSNQRFWKKRTRFTQSWVAGLLCAGVLWSTGPALAQTGELDPRLSVPVARENYAEADSVLILDDIRFDVMPDRSHAFDEHDAVKVMSKNGVDENATLVRVIDTSSSNVDVLLARTIKADGRILEAGPAQYSALIPNSKVYDSVKRFTVRFPNVEVGDIVEFHIRTTHKPKPGGHFWATTYVQNPMPILDSTFTVTIPKDIPFRTATPGHPGTKAVTEEFEKNGVTYTRMKWDIDEEDAFDFLPLAPKAISLLKRIEVSSFENWEQVADYVESQWQAKAVFSEGLALRVAGWMPVAGDIDARASALVKELNRKRKVAGFLAESPTFHMPAAVFDDELISSPDSSLLTSVALSAAGITNIPVATFGVNVKSLSDELPIPEKINKIVLQIPRSGMAPLWFDPDAPGFVEDILPTQTSDTAALSWDQRFDGGKTLTDLKSASAFENREEVSVEGRLEKSGVAELTLQFDRYGASSLDSRQAARDIQEGAREARDRALQTFFRNTTRSYGPRARLLGRYFELDSEASDPFSLSYTVAVPGYAQVQKETMLVPLPRFLSSGLRAAARQHNRKEPLVFDQPYQQDVRMHLIFPEGSRVTEAPPSIQKRTPEAEFIATGRVEGNEVWYVGRLTIFDPWIEGQEGLERNLETLKAALKSEDTILKVELSNGTAAKAPAEEKEGEESDS